MVTRHLIYAHVFLQIEVRAAAWLAALSRLSPAAAPIPPLCSDGLPEFGLIMTAAPECGKLQRLDHFIVPNYTTVSNIAIITNQAIGLVFWFISYLLLLFIMELFNSKTLNPSGN